MVDTDVSVKEIKINTPLEIVIHLATKEEARDDTGWDDLMGAVWNLDPPPHNTEVIRSGGIPSNRYVPCYVSDYDKEPNEHHQVTLARHSDEHGCYISFRGSMWKHATRVPEDKLWVPAAKDAE